MPSANISPLGAILLDRLDDVGQQHGDVAIGELAVDRGEFAARAAVLVLQDAT